MRHCHLIQCHDLYRKVICKITSLHSSISLVALFVVATHIRVKGRPFIGSMSSLKASVCLCCVYVRTYVYVCVCVHVCACVRVCVHA